MHPARQLQGTPCLRDSDWLLPTRRAYLRVLSSAAVCVPVTPGMTA